MAVRLTLLCVLLALPVAAFADKDAGKLLQKSGGADYLLPVPDALPSPARPDRPQPLIHEVRLASTKVHAFQVGKVRGIDVSHYQGQIDWAEVAKDGQVAFAYLKATESSGYVDRYYLQNLVGARKARIPVGIYHFFSPSTSALMQIENLRTNVNPRDHDLIPVVDVEKRGKKSLAQFHRELQLFLDAVERMYGVKPIIYTGVNFYAKYLEGRFRKYRFMVARYAEEFPGLSEDVPIVLWQYTCTGRVQGIRGNVDCSVFMDRYTLSDILLNRTKD